MIYKKTHIVNKERTTPPAYKITLCCTLALLLLFLGSCSVEGLYTDPLSPAIANIAAESVMVRSCLVGESVRFSAEDFARAVNLCRIDGITIVTPPSPADGELRLGNTVINAKRYIKAESLSLLKYVPRGDSTSGEFRFSVGTGYEMTCRLCVLDKVNMPPTIHSSANGTISVSTYRTAPLFGRLPAYDPEGDTLCIEIVSYPKKGILMLDDKSSGAYRYIPFEGASGKDSFEYVARDSYGNYSPSALIELTLMTPAVSAAYADMKDSPYYNGAIAMTEKGIMSGTQIGANLYFYPDRPVSRCEFVVMAMATAGISDLPSYADTPFEDGEDIPVDMRDEIYAAYEAGYIGGTIKEGGLFFEPHRAISRAEAAIIISSMLGSPLPVIKPVVNDEAEIPQLAQTAVLVASELGLLRCDEDNNIAPMKELSRGSAAYMLYEFSRLR